MKLIKIFKTALRALLAALRAFLCWVDSIVGMIETLINDVLQIVWGIFLLGVSHTSVIGVLVWILTL